MRRPVVFVVGIAALAWGAAASAEDAGAPAIGWNLSLPGAYKTAKEQGKPLFIAIVSERVDGGRVEPAGKELRENTYKNARVVEKSKSFVCVYLTDPLTSEDGGELRSRYGIEGMIVSPQHIFVRGDGTTLLGRHEYWPYGHGDASVTALLDLMDKALAKERAAAGTPDAPPAKPVPDAPAVPPSSAGPAAPAAPQAGATDPEARAKWIADVILMAVGMDAGLRKEALGKLLSNDQGGDCVRAVLAKMPEIKKDVDVLVDFVRALGRPKLEAAAAPLAEYLDAKEDALRANAAVSLEYVGSKQSVDPLLRAAAREKDEVIANHMYRALGRCGAGDDKARDVLVKHASAGKSDFATIGPLIGLAYFEKDAKAAREVEKLLVKEGLGSPGRRGWRGNVAVKRSIIGWVLSEIRDPKSEKFVREKVIPAQDTTGQWAAVVMQWWDAVAKRIGGDESQAGAVEQGVIGSFNFGGAGGVLQDEARKGRDAGFTPKGEWPGAGEGRPAGGAPGNGGRG